MDSLKARVLDVGLETGELHSPLSGMFSNISRVPSLQEALSPLENQLPRLPSHLKLAQLFLKTLRRKKQQYAQMPDDYCLVLNLYCMEDQPREDSTYYKMNAALRLKNREKVRQWRDFIWLLLHAMQWLSPSDLKFVYRGVMKNLSELGEGYEVGADVQWAGFSSTATKVEVMNSFLGQDGPRTLMNVELDSQWGRDLRDFSLFPSEEEILLPPNMMFEVTSVLDAGHGLTILQLKQVESPDILLQFEEHPHQTNQPAEPHDRDKAPPKSLGTAQTSWLDVFARDLDNNPIEVKVECITTRRLNHKSRGTISEEKPPNLVMDAYGRWDEAVPSKVIDMYQLLVSQTKKVTTWFEFGGNRLELATLTTDWKPAPNGLCVFKTIKKSESTDGEVTSEEQYSEMQVSRSYRCWPDSRANLNPSSKEFKYRIVSMKSPMDTPLAILEGCTILQKVEELVLSEHRRMFTIKKLDAVLGIFDVAPDCLGVALKQFQKRTSISGIMLSIYPEDYYTRNAGGKERHLEINGSTLWPVCEVDSITIDGAPIHTNEKKWVFKGEGAGRFLPNGCTPSFNGAFVMLFFNEESGECGLTLI